MGCFQLPTSQRLLNLMNDTELVDYLSDALLRCKTRRVNALLSVVLRMQLYQQFACRTSTEMELDYFDCSEIRNFYAIELIALKKFVPLAKCHSIFNDVDDLTKFRWQYATNKQLNVSCNSDDDQIRENDYFNQLLKTTHQFGCNINETCTNSNLMLKRIIEQIVDDSNKLAAACMKNPNIDLKRYSNELKYVRDLFHRLQGDT